MLVDSEGTDVYLRMRQYEFRISSEDDQERFICGNNFPHLFTNVISDYFFSDLDLVKLGGG